MAEQLQLGLSIDASGMTQAADKAAQQLQQKFTQAAGEIRKEFEKPAAMQLELNVKGDPRKAYQDTIGAQKEVLKNQKEIDRRRKLSAKLQDKVTRALKGTVKEKKAALKLVERLAKNTKLTAEEMNKLAGAAKELKKSLPKPSDMPSGSKTQNMEGNLFRAGVAANLATKGIEAMGRALVKTFRTGAEMQSLNLQMEAFAGGAQEADIAMRSFQNIAAKTPLDVMQVADAGKIMMAFGVDTNLAVEATERLAVTAAATGGDVNLLARNLGQVQAQGRAYTRDLTQFAIQGIPIWKELSNVTGRSVVELKEMAKEGKIGMESVMSALRNMTKEGSAFSLVAERMQETFAGKFALIESEFQVMAGKIVESMATIDEALGTSSVVTALVDGMKNVGLIFEAIGTGMAEANYQSTIMEGKIGKLTEQKAGFFERILIDPFESASIGAQKNSELLKTAAQRYRENNTELQGAKYIADQYEVSLNGLTSKLAALASIPGNEGLVRDFRAQAQAAGDIAVQLNKQISKQMEASGITSAEVQKQIDSYKEQKNAVEEVKVTIEQYYTKRADAATRAFEQEKSLDEEFIASKELVIAKLDEQIAKTRELGPAGKKLEAIRRKELEYTARTGKELKGHVSEEQKKKLQAQASLERMNSQAEAAELQKQKLVEQEAIRKRRELMEQREAEHQEKMRRIENDKKTALEKQNTIIDNLNTSIESLSRVLQGDLVGGWDELEKLIGNADTKTGEVDTATKNYNTTINGTIRQLDRVNGRLDVMRKKILTMPKLPKAAPNAFSGGPVSGGDKRTVNELGKEAFLSASGKLSMINAPAWGEWKAPSSGTIIPAHLTKQLDIPTGGINLNKTAGSRAGVGGAMSVVQAAGGDTFHQNVTVQAANPTQAANNLMVEMTRLRRRRFR